MKTYIFYLVGNYGAKKQRIKVDANTTLDAISTISNKYKNWEISMFWLVWP